MLWIGTMPTIVQRNHWFWRRIKALIILFSLLYLASIGILCMFGADQSVPVSLKLEEQGYVDEEACFFKDIGFKKSFEKMMTAFKVFVYPQGDPGTYYHSFHNPVPFYASEAFFFRNLESGELRTLDPDEADAFFIPISLQKMGEKGLELKEMGEVVEKYIQEISMKYPYWNKTSGADHFFVSCHDMALKATQAVPDLAKRAIRIVCYPEYEDGFLKDKDIVLPQVEQPFRHPDPGTDIKKRTEVIFMGDDIILRTAAAIRYGSNRASFMLNDRFMSWLRKRRTQDRYVMHILNQNTSKFCLCPNALEMSDARVTNAIHYGCVPVVWPDLYELPFSDLINWNAFSVQMNKDDELVPQHLEEIPEAIYGNLQSNTIKVRKYFQWNPVPMKYDAFTLVMYQLWCRLRITRISTLIETPPL